MGTFLRPIAFGILMVPMNNLASIRHCHRVEVGHIIPRVLVPGHLLLFILSNDFPVIFRVFINIHEYANEMIFI